MEELVAANPGAVFIEKRGRKRTRLRLRDRTAVSVVVCRSAPNVISGRHWYVPRTPYDSRRFALLALLNRTNHRIEHLFMAKNLMRVDFTLWERSIADLGAVSLDEPAHFVDIVERLRRP